VAEINLIGLYEKALPSYFSWEEKLSLAKYAGYDFLEISVDESDEKLSRVLNVHSEQNDIVLAANKTGVPVLSMCLSANRRYPIGSKCRETRLMGIEIIKGAVRLSVGIGIRVIQLAGYDEFYNESDHITQSYFLESLQECVGFAERYNVMLAIETMDTEPMGSISNIMSYVNKINSPWLNIYPDIGNMSSRKVDIERDFISGRNHIVAVHVKDTREREFRRVGFGEGIVDFDAFFKLMLEINFRGPLVVEMWSDDELGYVAEVKRAREFLLEKFNDAQRKIVTSPIELSV
jgi:predicted hexulose-6-phosphate isomerase